MVGAAFPLLVNLCEGKFWLVEKCLVDQCRRRHPSSVVTSLFGETCFGARSLVLFVDFRATKLTNNLKLWAPKKHLSLLIAFFVFTYGFDVEAFRCERRMDFDRFAGWCCQLHQAVFIELFLLLLVLLL